MPMRAFWHFSGTVDRLFADEAKLTFELHACVQSPESGEEMRKHLHDQAPNPVKLTGAAIAEATAVFDQDGLNDLRSMSMAV